MPLPHTLAHATRPRVLHYLTATLATLAVLALMVSWAASATAAEPADSTVVIRWEAPADDGTEAATGPASRYELRFRTTPIVAGDLEAWWSDAISVNGMPSPGSPGAAEAVTIGDLSPTVAYYFVMRAVDAAGNWSPFSNVLRRPVLIDGIPPAAIRDLNVVH